MDIYIRFIFEMILIFRWEIQLVRFIREFCALYKRSSFLSILFCVWKCRIEVREDGVSTLLVKRVTCAWRYRLLFYNGLHVSRDINDEIQIRVWKRLSPNLKGNITFSWNLRKSTRCTQVSSLNVNISWNNIFLKILNI